MIDAQSLREFRKICKVTHGVALSEIEAQEAAMRVIKFLVASGEQPSRSSLTDREARALIFIQRSIEQGYAPSVRSIASHLNLASSRSAHLIVQSLVAKRIIVRNEEGRLLVVH